MKRFSGKHSPAWMQALKKQNIDPSHLSLKELGAFRDFELFLNERIPGPPKWQYLVRCFRWLTAFGIITMQTQGIEALSRCWHEMMEMFIDAKIFEDDVFVQSWIFCDFPLDNDGKTVLDLFEKFVQKSGEMEDFQSFINGMRQSRLGLYQEMLNSKKTIKFRELISGKTAEVFRSIDEFEKGEIFLTRLVNIEVETYCFGDPKCWPKEYKTALEDMVRNKLFYFKAPTVEQQFEKFMKLAGPYWFSCVVQDQSFPILNPDHYLEYHGD